MRRAARLDTFSRELLEVAPRYDRYWKGALEWLISVPERDADGRMAWYMSRWSLSRTSSCSTRPPMRGVFDISQKLVV